MLLPKRIWKDIKGYEGIYQVANIPYANKKQVRSVDRYVTDTKGRKRLLKGKLMKGNLDRDGYLRVNLSKNGKNKTFFIHRLVALHFVNGYFEGAVVNHKNEQKDDNRAENLEFCTIAYNNNYGTHNEKISKSSKGKIICEEQKNKIREVQRGKNNNMAKKVKCIELDIIFDCVADANEYLGKDRYNCGISNCCNGRQKTAYGMEWCYIED